MYLSPVRLDLFSFSIRALACGLAVLASPLCAAWQWGVPDGGTTLKVLSVPVSARSAALAGSGLASPQSGAEMFGNPLAPAAVNEAALGFGQVYFAERVGGTLSLLNFVQPWNSLRFAGGLEYLRNEDIAGRDEDGLETGEYGAGTYAVQLGVAAVPGAFSYGVTGRFASQSIDGFHSRAVLCDAGAGFRLNRYFRIATAMTNLGWVEPFDGRAETAPLAVQAGMTGSYEFAGSYALSWHGDLYRRADTDTQFLTGAELAYFDILFLRLGFPFRAGEDGPSGGLGIKAGLLGVDYAYSSRPALKGNHHFGIRLNF